jgi:hypothetical protein
MEKNYQLLLHHQAGDKNKNKQLDPTKKNGIV